MIALGNLIGHVRLTIPVYDSITVRTRSGQIVIITQDTFADRPVSVKIDGKWVGLVNSLPKPMRCLTREGLRWVVMPRPKQFLSVATN